MLGKQLYGIVQVHTLGDSSDDLWSIVLNKSAIREGAIKSIGGNTVLLLLAISSYMDNDGFCYPTQRQLADVLGWTQKTVSNNMEKLLQAEWNGKKLITRSLEGSKVKHSEYQIVKPEAEVKKRISPKAVLMYFDKIHLETYGVKYHHTNGKVNANMVKTKLIDNYRDEQIIKFIDVVFANYEIKWSNKKFPRPTIGTLCTWLINEVMIIIQEEEKINQKIADSEPVDYDKLEREMEEYLK